MRVAAQLVREQTVRIPFTILLLCVLLGELLLLVWWIVAAIRAIVPPIGG